MIEFLNEFNLLDFNIQIGDEIDHLKIKYNK